MVKGINDIIRVNSQTPHSVVKVVDLNLRDPNVQRNLPDPTTAEDSGISPNDIHEDNHSLWPVAQKNADRNS